jgi:UDP-N-acetylmuramoyl-L-alanyl-D-glutamate--2,6-diaminopimelate ligase
MLHHTLLARGRASGVIGTSGTRYRDAGGRDHGIGTVRTTPEATDLHGILARMVEDEVTSCAMEVSSHALVLHRVDGVVYDVACFTGLSQDHLDFHHTMEEYYRAKASLFTPERARRAVICVDEEWGRRLARETPLPHLTYASRPGTPADVSVLEARPEGFGTRIRIRRENADEQELYSPLPGEHYVANAIAVMLLLEAIGQEGPEVREAIGRAGTVPGRMERVAEHPVRGIVDFSHTEDALDGALRTLRAAAPGSASRLLIVLGAGGDRDRGKRPHMGAVAGRLADVVIITDDNPRSEDPAVIREQVAAGIPPDSAAEVHVVAGRAEAITLACALAHVSDTILVAGKGAERGQDIGGTVLPFDDRVQLDRALRARFGTTGPDGAPVTEGRS